MTAFRAAATEQLTDLKRRLAGDSSGDLVTAKRPELGPVEAIA